MKVVISSGARDQLELKTPIQLASLLIVTDVEPEVSRRTVSDLPYSIQRENARCLSSTDFEKRSWTSAKGTVKLVLPPLFLSLRGYAQLLPPLLSPLCSSKSSSLRCCGKPPLYPVPISESLMEVSYSQSIQWPSVPRPSINDYDRFTIARSIESQNRVSLKESTCDV